jgi:hypothetical protein
MPSHWRRRDGEYGIDTDTALSMVTKCCGSIRAQRLGAHAG